MEQNYDEPTEHQRHLAAVLKNADEDQLAQLNVQQLDQAADALDYINSIEAPEHGQYQRWWRDDAPVESDEA